MSSLESLATLSRERLVHWFKQDWTAILRNQTIFEAECGSWILRGLTHKQEETKSAGLWQIKSEGCEDAHVQTKARISQQKTDIPCGSVYGKEKVGRRCRHAEKTYWRKSGIRAPGPYREILSTPLARPVDAARQDCAGYKNPGGETVLEYLWLELCCAIEAGEQLVQAVAEYEKRSSAYPAARSLLFGRGFPRRKQGRGRKVSSSNKPARLVCPVDTLRSRRLT